MWLFLIQRSDLVIQGAVSMLLYLLCALERRIVGAEKADILPCAAMCCQILRREAEKSVCSRRRFGALQSEKHIFCQPAGVNIMVAFRRVVRTHRPRNVLERAHLGVQHFAGNKKHH